MVPNPTPQISDDLKQPLTSAGSYTYKQPPDRPGGRGVSPASSQLNPNFRSGAHKPNSVLTVIPLRPPLLSGSSDLPGDLSAPSRHSLPIWSCSVWGLPCDAHHCTPGALLPHLFTLTPPKRGGMFSVALAVAQALKPGPRTLSGTPLYGVRTFLAPAAPRNRSRAYAARPRPPGPAASSIVAASLTPAASPAVPSPPAHSVPP